MKRIIIFTSIHKMGLTSQLTEQALCLNRMRQGEFLFLSGENEQFPGLFDTLQKNSAPYTIINGMDEHADFFRLVKEFKDVVDKFRPDFIEVHTNWQLAIAAFVRFVSKTDYGIVYVIHGYRHNYTFRSIIARYFIGAALLLFADHVIAPCTFLKNQFRFLKKKTKVIFIGEDKFFFEDYPLPSFKGKLRFIFAGMFRAGKNQDVLIRVVKKYINQSGDKNIELYLPGDGPLLETNKQLARQLEIADKVIFPGVVNRAEIIELYKICQFAVAPTNVETFGHCITEPFILGRVVLTRHIGVADDIIINGENGFFFDTENDLFENLKKILPDNELCYRVASNAKRKRDQFRWELVCQKRFALIYNKPIQE